jgi:hypothetical protein
VAHQINVIKRSLLTRSTWGTGSRQKEVESKFPQNRDINRSFHEEKKCSKKFDTSIVQVTYDGFQNIGNWSNE